MMLHQRDFNISDKGAFTENSDSIQPALPRRSLIRTGQPPSKHIQTSLSTLRRLLQIQKLTCSIEIVFPKCELFVGNQSNAFFEVPTAKKTNSAYAFKARPSYLSAWMRQNCVVHRQIGPAILLSRPRMNSLELFLLNQTRKRVY